MKRYKLLLLLSIFIGVGIFSQSISGEIELKEENLTYGKYKDYDQVFYHDDKRVILNRSETGSPDIPSISFSVIVPPDAVFQDIEFYPSTREIIGSSFNALPCQPPTSSLEESPVFVEPDDSVYRSGNQFPSSGTISFLNEVLVRGYKVFNFNWDFMQYEPLHKQLWFTKQINYKINYTLDRTTRSKLPTHSFFADILAKDVENSESIESFYGMPDNETNRSENIDFLIITSERNIEKLTKYGLERQRETELSFKVVPHTYIMNNFEGPTPQLKIKRCIQKYIKDHNILYAMITGKQTKLPNQTYTQEYDGEKKQVDTHMFYSCMDGQFDWNKDGDSIIGEHGKDGADSAPDVIFGRLPHPDYNDYSTYPDKIKRYKEKCAGDPEYLGKLLFASSIYKDGSKDDITRSELLDEVLSGSWLLYNPTKLLESDSGLLDSDLIKKNLKNEYNILYLDGHGSPSHIALEGKEKLKTPVAHNTDYISSLYISGSCHSLLSLAEPFINNTYGGTLVSIGNTNIGLYNPGNFYKHTNQYLLTIFDYLAATSQGNSVTFGEAFTETKIKMARTAFANTNTWLVHNNLNLLGDPTVKFRTTTNLERVGVKGNATEIAVLDDDHAFKLDDTYIYRYEDGEWNKIKGLASAIDVDRKGKPVVVNKYGDIFKGNGYGSWKKLPKPPGDAIVKDIACGSGSEIYAVTNTNNIYKYKDSSSSSGSWKIYTTIVFPPPGRIERITANKDNIYFTTDNGYLYRVRKANIMDNTIIPELVFISYPVLDIDVGKNNELYATVQEYPGKEVLYRRGVTSSSHYLEPTNIPASRVAVGTDGLPWITVNTTITNDDGNIYKTYNGIEQIQNPSFKDELGLEYWGSKEFKGADCTLDLVNNEIVMRVDNGGYMDWHTYLFQEGIKLVEGGEYRVSFDIRKDRPGVVSPTLLIGRNGYPWDTYKSLRFDVTSSNKKIETDFIMDNETDLNTLFRINFGTINNETYYLDNFTLHRIFETPQVAGTVKWEERIAYNPGDIIIYNNSKWKCTYTHTSQVDWYPGAPGLWFWDKM